MNKDEFLRQIFLSLYAKKCADYGDRSAEDVTKFLMAEARTVTDTFEKSYRFDDSLIDYE